ncbi:MAG: metallophosphoesterase [Devosiaceae bacterium]|nr:metallophosphoesterase [Devosiaceae bacterium]
MSTIAHISDIHLAPLPKVRLRDLINKRATGYINWKLKRNHDMCPDAAKNLADHLSSQRADISVVTGDLVNLALPKEVETATKWLRRLGTSSQVCMVPGNHDAYLHGALAKAQKAYGPYASGETLDQSPYPFVRRVGQVAVIGCSSAIATPPFIAAGHFDKKQGERLTKCLQILGDAGFFRIVAIHHPPIKQFIRPYRKALAGAKLFRQILKANGAEMVLHGHTHKSSIHTIEGLDSKIPVIGVAAASTCPSSNSPPARYNLFKIEKLQNRWSCTMREFGYQRVGENIVQRLQLRIY